MAGAKENIIQKQCLQILSAYNIFHWRQNSGCIHVRGHVYKMTSISGVSDILGILPDGRFLAIECKREKGGIVSQKQKEFLNAIEKNGGVALVVNNPMELNKKLKDLLFINK